MKQWAPTLLAYCQAQEGLSDLAPIFTAMKETQSAEPAYRKGKEES
jgi:hypothetical protein